MIRSVSVPIVWSKWKEMEETEHSGIETPPRTSILVV